MSDQRQAIVAKLKALIEARKAAIRVRIVDKAFAQIAAAVILMMAVAGSAEARTVYRPSVVTTKARTVIVVVPQYVQPQRIVYYAPPIATPVAAPICRPVAAPRPRYTGSSKYSPSN
jgi:hypothetical protein